MAPGPSAATQTASASLINTKATYLGPLTTVFTPPSTYFDVVTQWFTSDFVIFHGINGDPNCYPGNVCVLSQNLTLITGHRVCPSGFTEACQDRQQ
jgi:hypothetical protein